MTDSGHGDEGKPRRIYDDPKQGIGVTYSAAGIRIDAIETHPDCRTLLIPWPRALEMAERYAAEK